LPRAKDSIFFKYYLKVFFAIRTTLGQTKNKIGILTTFSFVFVVFFENVKKLEIVFLRLVFDAAMETTPIKHYLTRI
jgi:hypothetical protein